jgi:hypothetical protein
MVVVLVSCWTGLLPTPLRPIKRRRRDAAWSLYDTRLFNYLASYPTITEAIDKFGRTYSSVAGP